MIGRAWKAPSFVFAEAATPCLAKITTSSHLEGLDARRALLVLGIFLAAQVGGGALVGLLAGLGAAARGVDLSDPAASAELTHAMSAPAGMAAMLAAAVALGQLTRSFEWPPWPTGLCRATGQALGWVPATGPELRIGLVTGASLGLAYVWLASGWLPPSSGNRPEPLGQLASSSGLALYVWVFLVLVAAPVLEEFVFRGVLFGGLARSWGAPVAAVVVTGAFVALHLPETGLYWPALVAIALVGASALVVRLRSESLAPAVALHAAYNLVIVLGVLAHA